MEDFEEKMLENFEKKTVIWWRYTDDIFFIWEHGEKSLKIFIEQVNISHPKIKLYCGILNRGTKFFRRKYKTNRWGT